jgi:hypothetical protein
MKNRVLSFTLLLSYLLLMITVSMAKANDDRFQNGLTVSILPQSAQIGSIATLTLQYVLPEGAVLPEKAGLKGLEGLTVLDLEYIPSEGKETPAGEENLSGEIRVKLLIDTLGAFTTGPLSVTFKDKEGGEALLSAAPVSLSVLSNLGEKPEEAVLKPIYDILPTGFEWKTETLWAGAVLLLCLLAGGFLWWRKKRRFGGQQEILRILPHVTARESIQVLEGEKLFEQGQLKVFYFRFSEIMRKYLEELRGFPAAEYTTQEISLAMKDPKDRDFLPLLKQADLVKFADFRPTQARKEEGVKQALGYIDDTCVLFETEMDQHSEKRQIPNTTIRQRARGGRRFR